MTGDDMFNRSLRYFVSRKDKSLSLSDHGLRRVSRLGKEKESVGDNTLDAKTEEEIFAHLGLDYRAPEKRSVRKITEAKRAAAVGATELSAAASGSGAGGTGGA
jgi:DNA polymerase/3'-5' exonuclease PolX